MNKEQYLKQMAHYLGRMPKEERDDIIGELAEFFECAKDEDDEAALCGRLGDPRKLSREYLAQSVIASANETKKLKKLKSMLLAFMYSAGLGIVNMLYAVFVVSIGYIGISVFYIVAVALAAGAVAGLIAAAIHLAAGALALWFCIFAAGALISAGVLMFIGNMQLTKAFNKANMAFLNNISEKIRKAGEEK